TNSGFTTSTSRWRSPLTGSASVIWFAARKRSNFMLPSEKEPLFGNNLVEVTRAAADKLAQVFNSLVRRKVDPVSAQRFVLQCLVVMFSEDVDVLPRSLLHDILEDCDKGQSSYDLIGALFRQMNSAEPAKGGRYLRVPYFDGGLFQTIDPVDLNSGDIWQLQ